MGHDSTGTEKGFIYRDGIYTELLPPGWNNMVSNYIGINNSGVVVGSGVDSTGTLKGFIYSDGVYTELLPPGWSRVVAEKINENGVVLGNGSRQ